MSELCNMLYGNSFGDFEVPRTARFEGPIAKILEKSGLDSYGCPGFENDVFAVRSYWWGDCECGYDQRAAEWSDTHKHANECYWTHYHRLSDEFDRSGKSKYGPGNHKTEFDRLAKALCKKYGIPWNMGYGSAVHCTCEYDGLWREWSSANTHSDNCPTVLPNFHFKPTDYRLKWYKYPLRDSYANRFITADELDSIAEACVTSLLVTV